MDYKILFLIFGIILSTIWYIPYIRNIFKGKTKPHMFTWIILTLVTLVGAIIQLSDGAWMWGIIILSTAVLCFIIVILSINYWEKEITKSDKNFFLMAISSIILWIIIGNPILSIIIITITEFLGFLPTIRKSYRKPYEETIILFIITSFSLAFSIFALGNYSFLTVFYPSSLILLYWWFFIFLFIRRIQLKKL